MASIQTAFVTICLRMSQRIKTFQWKSKEKEYKKRCSSWRNYNNLDVNVDDQYWRSILTINLDDRSWLPTLTTTLDDQPWRPNLDDQPSQHWWHCWHCWHCWHWWTNLHQYQALVDKISKAFLIRWVFNMDPRDANASKNDKRPFNLNLDKRTKCWQVCEGLVLTVIF